MRAVVCLLHFGVAWIALASSGASSSAEHVSGMDIYEFESWVSCLDSDEVTCHDKNGTHASYNRLTGTCEERNGTECEGGENHFKDMMTCNKSCNNAPKPPCSLKENYGVGRAHNERWYFNTTTANCTHFIWGGITGNDNNFETLEKCQTTCSGFTLLKKVNVTINGPSP
uniref:BPTI/Kunitz inhibitor domain-containing protein n=1 Tax=Ixodes ricinus TaxID=34613 RepID=V5H6H1_IXORI